MRVGGERRVEHAAPMAITYRAPEPEDFEPFLRPVMRGFGMPSPDADEFADQRMLWERERSLGALDGDEWVGGTGAFTMDLTLPGGDVVPAAGVTMVGVDATHRRRGILTELMRRQLDDITAAGEPTAILTASESLIYGRFGYGLATRGVRLRLATSHGRFRSDAPVAAGRLNQLTINEARAVLPAAYERIRAGRPGAVARSHAWWETHVFLDRPAHRDGGSALYVLVHTAGDGVVDGWATYRVLASWPDRLPEGTVLVTEMMAVDDTVALALWRSLLDVDLSAEVDALHVPLDDPLWWAVTDPRRVRSSGLSDWLWLRFLDIPAGLGPRRWGGPGTVVLDVVDPFRPASGGRFRAEADADGRGQVAPTDAEPDVVLGAEELGTIALGGVAPSALARVGRVHESTPGALAVADTLFRTDVAPHCATMF